MRGRRRRLDSLVGVARARTNRIGTYWPRNVLEGLLAKISELNRDLSANVVMGRRRKANATRRGNALKPRRNVDAIAEDVLAFDQDVPKIDPDPEEHLTINGYAFVPLCHHLLHSHGELNRI